MDPLERVRLGRTGVEVTRLGLGTAPLGGLYAAVADAVAEATVNRAYELGWRFFDTAPLYGYGVAEQRLGRSLASRPRDDYALATKVGRVLEPDGGRKPGKGEDLFKGVPALAPRFDFSAPGVLRSFQSSLDRLGVERIDVLHIHDPDDHEAAAIEHSLPALASLRVAGTIGAVGAGMNQTEMLCRFAERADFDVFLLAGRYTLLDRSGADELLPLCADREIAVICGGVYNSGVLAGGDTYDYAQAPERIRERVRMMENACDRFGVPLAAAALRFPLRHPAVTCVVVGARSPEEVEANDALFRTKIPDGLWEELEVL